MQITLAEPMANHTTLRLGGPAERFVTATTTDEIVDAVKEADAAGGPVMVLGGGSNLVVGDEGVQGTVVHMCSDRLDLRSQDGWLRITADAGVQWDNVVVAAVEAGAWGIEALTGIPGSAGATPVQNVGAYGQEVASTITSVEVWDRKLGERVTMSQEELEFSYRHSVLKFDDRRVVLRARFLLPVSGGLSGPINYRDLAAQLDVGLGERAPLAEVREAVFVQRRKRGMVVDPADPDSVSAGSFFTNPVLDAEQWARLDKAVAARTDLDGSPPRYPAGDGKVKTSAAWLIERAGFAKGWGEGPVGLSKKHTLALVNRGGATTAELVTAARAVREGVRSAFGVVLDPEPVLIGVEI